MYTYIKVTLNMERYRRYRQFFKYNLPIFVFVLFHIKIVLVHRKCGQIKNKKLFRHIKKKINWKFLIDRYYLLILSRIIKSLKIRVSACNTLYKS